MIEFNVKRARTGREAKIVAKIPITITTELVTTLGVTVSARVTMHDVHLYSAGVDMSHDDWTALAEQINALIAEIRQRNEHNYGTPSNS